MAGPGGLHGDPVGMLSVWTWRALWRRLLCRISGREPRVEGRCLQCGSCCREIVLCHEGRWIRSRKEFNRLLHERPGYERMEPVGRDADGRTIFTCSWLGPDGRCRDYENRLPVCRNHPGPTLWLRGVDLRPTCGYRLTGPSLFGFLRRKRQLPAKSFRSVLERECSARNATGRHQNTEEDSDKKA